MSYLAAHLPHLPHPAAFKLRIAKRHAPAAFALLMSAMMSGIMSSLITAMNTGFTSGFAARWMHAWGIAFSLAFPLVLFLAPRVRKAVESITE